MAIQSLAYSAQQYLQSRTSISFKRAHLYELLASLFGFKSYAAFCADAVLTDAGGKASQFGVTSQLRARITALGYPAATSGQIAEAFVEYVRGQGLSFVTIREVISILTPPPSDDERDDTDDEEWDDDLRDVEAHAAQRAAALRQSVLLIASLEQAAGRGNPDAHFALAAVYRCAKPNGYLYEESLTGRILTKIEQEWADAYLQLKPRFSKYEYHLRQAATGGVRQAAVEFADVFNSEEFYVLAERGAGPIDARRMAKIARSREARDYWLRVAAEEGLPRALETLADRGDTWALRRMAEAGDVDAIRDLAHQAVETDMAQAWMWQYLAQMLGTDLTESTLRAYHEDGLRAGQQYDDDFGGALYVDGDEGLPLIPLDTVQARAAKKLAREIFRKIRE